MPTLELLSIFTRLDYAISKPGTDPTTWRTLDGEPLTAEQLEVVRIATPEDAQALHDLAVLDARVLGLPPPCLCGHTEEPDG